MHDSALLTFLLSLGVLFASAKVFGALARALAFPAVVGEIFAGILVGKTLLGRVWPEAFAWLFPEGPAATMLHGYQTIAIVLLLAVAGLEIELETLRRRGRGLVLSGVCSLALPFAAGYAVGLVLPERYLVAPELRSLHALFFGVALSISALPVITRTLMDLGLLRSQVGMMVLTTAVINDVVGWVCFSALVRQLRDPGGAAGSGVLLSLAMTLGFVIAALLVLRPVVDRWLRAIERSSDHLSATPGALSMIVILAMLGAAATELLGIHAVFGGFVVGMAVGRASSLRPETRHVLKDCVTTLFTPVFFATMGLRFDFVRSFELELVLIVLAVATIAKVLGGTAGARLAGLGRNEAWAVGFGLNSRGAMEILLAAIALEAGLIHEAMFVALVTMALVTSILSGPAMAALLRAPRPAPEATADLAAPRPATRAS